MENFEQGLEHIAYAAQVGNLRARAVFARLRQACDQKVPEETPIIELLEEATAADDGEGG